MQPVFQHFREEKCIQVCPSTGDEYHETSCLYPSIEPFYFGWETKYDPFPVIFWMQAHAYVPIVIVALYGLSITVGRKMMEKREPFQWRKGLVAWNLFLSIFSFIGISRTLPILMHNLLHLPMRYNFCTSPVMTHGAGSSGLWVQLFILSKIPELFDTLFIVAHKKPLIFLHWYHHVTVLLYCWHSYVTFSPFCLFFVCMNYSVHGCMYGYYCLAAAKCKPKWLKPIYITVFQISQMVVGVIVAIMAFYYYVNDEDGTCAIEKENNIAAFTMYGSYLFLFLQFFIKRYLKVSAIKVKKIK